MPQFDQVSVVKKANVFFDGRCVSHTVILADGSRKSIGVIMPSTLTFNTAAAERMEIIAGTGRYQLPGGAWQSISAGQHFDVPADSQFEIEATEPLHYLCHFA